MDTSKPRIHGTEMEWGAMISSDAYPDDLLQLEAGQFGSCIPEELRSLNIQSLNSINNYFLSNGARLYQDVGERWEYATPEDTSFMGTTANEIAGERVLAAIAKRYESRFDSPVSLTKRVIDDREVGCGYHASYCAESHKIEIDEQDLALFGVFAATRSVLFGSGALLPEGKFIIGQKASTVNKPFSMNTVNIKPVVNLREEGLADPDRFVRVHDTSSDPSISPWANRVKLGAASLVIRMIEQGKTMSSICFSNPLDKVTREVAVDHSLQKRYQLGSNGSATALDIQKVLVHNARLLSKEVTLPDEELWTLDEWEHALSDLSQNPELTTNRIEWVARRKILIRQQEKHAWGWDSAMMRYKDIQFSEISMSGIANALRETIWADYMPPEEMIQQRLHNPPKSTRANVRGEFIKQSLGLGKSVCAAGWDRVVFNQQTYYLPDPYVCHSDVISSFQRPSPEVVITEWV